MQKINLNGVDIIKHIARTKYSNVYIVKSHNNSNNNINILKQVNKDLIIKGGNIKVEMLKRERSFYETNSNPLYPSFIRSHKDDEYIYMEITFMEGINMSKLLLNEKLLQFNTKHSCLALYMCLISQIIDMLLTLHKATYTYRDLKMNNLIINKDLTCYLVDFGFVKRMEQRDRTFTICGTPHMKAPELYGDDDEGGYDPFKVDVYSVGVLMYEMFKGKAPFPYVVDNEVEYAKMVVKGVSDGEEYFGKEFYGDVDDEDTLNDVNNVKDVILWCMNVDSGKRPTLVQVTEHKLFKGRFEYYKSEAMRKSLFCFRKEDYHLREVYDYIEYHGEYKSDLMNKCGIGDNGDGSDDVFKKYF